MFAAETLITPAADMTNWQNIIVAIITASSLIAVAYLQFVYKSGKKRGEEAHVQWKQNKEDHEYVVAKITDLGRSLGISIDRVEATAIRTEEKLDQHINDHATGKLLSRSSKKAE